MKTSPFKVMTSAALATSLALPVAATTVDAAETEVKQIAFELDGEVTVVDYADYVDAIISESGELYEYTQEAEVTAIGVGDGVYVDYDKLVSAILDADADKTAKEVLAEQAENEDALVSEDTVAEYKDWTDEDDVTTISEVTANNLKQVEVELAGNVDADIAADVDNYTLENDGEEVELSSAWLNDGKLTLNLKSAVSNQSTLSLTVDGAVTGEEETFDVEFFDTTVPEVTGAEVVGQDTIKVMFSEPMDAYDENGELKSSVKNAFEVNGGELFVSEVTPLKNNTEFNVELYSSLEEGTVDVAVNNNIEDYAGFNAVSKSLELDVVEDDEAPSVVDYKNASPNSVTLVFNEEIELTEDATFESFYHTNSSNEVIEGTEDGEPKGYTLEGNELTLNFGEGSELPEGTAYVYVDGGAVVDLWGNVNDNQLRTKVEVEIDETEPTLSEISVDAEDSITATFSEKLANVDEDDFTLLDSEGEEADLIQSISHSDDEVTVNFTEKLSGQYALVVEDLTDLSGNEIDKVTEAFNVDDLTAPVIDGTTTPNISGDGFSATLYNPEEDVQTLVVNFGESMATDGKYSVVDLEKYVLDGTELADLDGVTIDPTDNASKVEIKIPYDSENENTLNLESGQSYNLEIARVADSAGNTTDMLADSITVADEGSVSIDSAVAVDTETVKVTFDDRLVDFDSADLSIEDSNGSVAVSSRTVSVNDNGNTVVTYKLDNALNTNATNSNGQLKVVIPVVSDGTTESNNKYGETLEEGQEVTVQDYIEADLDEVATDGNDDDQVEATRATVNGEDTISFDLEFTENVTGSSEAFGTFFEIGDFDFQPNAANATEGDFTVARQDDNTVTVTVYSNTMDDFDVDYTQNKFFYDKSGNKNQVDDFSVTVDVYQD